MTTAASSGSGGREDAASDTGEREGAASDAGDRKDASSVAGAQDDASYGSRSLAEVSERARSRRLTAAEAIAEIADPGSWIAWRSPEPSVGAPVDDVYSTELAAARARTGQSEAVLVGGIRIDGRRAALLSWEFGFLGGSVGVAVASRVVAAVRRATRESLPLLTVTRSGGTRMQEGTPAFVQMAAIAAALAEHRRAGLPHLVHLGDPTTGGVLATIGSAGDLTTAEPGALVGFLGPRAVGAITGEVFPAGIQVAEHLVACGVVDEVLTWHALRQRWATLVGLWSDAHSARTPGGERSVGAGPRRVSASRGGGAGGTSAPLAGSAGPEDPAALWTLVQATRAADRVTADQLLAVAFTDRVPLPGTAGGETSRAVRVELGRLRGRPVLVAATVDRVTGHAPTGADLRTIRRGIALAQRWGLPVITVVDTRGAALSVAAEEEGLAGEIARLMLDHVSCITPTVSLLLGAGTGGAALALLAADRVVAASHGWVAPLAPEGAAAIRHGGAHDPARMAWDQRIGAHALAELGVVDVLVDEADPDWLRAAAQAVSDQLDDVASGARPDRRVARFAAWST